MFRRLINNNVKIIGIRRFSNDYNHKIVKELDKINRTLDYIYFNTLLLNIVTCITTINH